MRRLGTVCLSFVMATFVMTEAVWACKILDHTFGCCAHHCTRCCEAAPCSAPSACNACAPAAMPAAPAVCRGLSSARPVGCTARRRRRTRTRARRRRAAAGTAETCGSATRTGKDGAQACGVEGRS